MDINADFTDEEAAAAAAVENAAYQEAVHQLQLNYLNRRVLQLKARCTRLEDLLNEHGLLEDPKDEVGPEGQPDAASGDQVESNEEDKA